MRIIPVLDLAGGMAVHARGGRRAGYLPVTSALAPEEAGAVLPLARSFRARLGAEECYVADLDAIGGRPPQLDLLTRLAHPTEGFGSGLMVDAGTSDLTMVQSVLETGASTVIIGLETLGSTAELSRIVLAVGHERIVFSLDLWEGKPRLPPGGPPVGSAMMDIVEVVSCAGVARMIVLDLSRVGSGAGVDLDLVHTLRRRFPAIRLVAGGGIRGAADLRALEACGCEGVLVGTALHDGTLGPGDWSA
jgi:phosphoribosylformimino-5-aminoimidazole carboxamide ribotide isomerase